MITRSIFRNDELELHFRKYGVVKIPFFNTSEVSNLTNLCKQLDGEFNTAFTTTIWSTNANYRTRVYEELKKIYLSNINQVLLNCKAVMATILTKHPGQNSGLDIHQDWTFTDEVKYSAVNIWVPLVDTDAENGTLCFLPYSHLFKVPYRGRHVSSQFTDVKDLIWKLGKTYSAKAGEALIFNVKMVHYSNPNTSSNIRTAVSMVAIPEEAPILHYINYNPQKDRITEMEVDQFFYNSYSHNDIIPKSENSKEFEFRRNQMDKETFEKEYNFLHNRYE